MKSFFRSVGWRGLAAISILLLLFVGALMLSKALTPPSMGVPYGVLGAGEHEVSLVVNHPATVQDVEATFYAGELARSTEKLTDDVLSSYIRFGVQPDDNRFAIRMQGNFPAETIIDLSLVGALTELSDVQSCRFFTGMGSGQIVQFPTGLNADGVTIDGWKIDTTSIGYSADKRFEPDWGELHLSKPAETVIIYCYSQDNYSTNAGATMTVNYPRLTLTVEGQTWAPSFNADYYIWGPVDLRVMAGSTMTSPRPSLFALLPKWSKQTKDYLSDDETPSVEATWFTRDAQSPVGVSRASYAVNPPDDTKLGVEVSSYWRWTEVESVSGQSQSQKLAAIGGGIFGFGLGLLAPIGAIIWKSVPRSMSSSAP